MSEALHMIQLRLDTRAAMTFGHERHMPRHADELGYVLHAILREAFGARAPQPFAVTAHRGGRLEVLGYSTADDHALRDHLQRFARPELVQAIAPERVAGKAMPARWDAGMRVAFEVRVCPVVRQRGGDGKRSRETDAFIAETQQVDKAVRVRREDVYRCWLEQELAREGAARLLRARMSRFQRVRLPRRTQPAGLPGPDSGEAKAGSAPRRNGRRWHAAEKPDATFHGEIEVGEPGAFAALLRRGLGRHRAFGFGMLLLRPPRRS